MTEVGSWKRTLGDAFCCWLAAACLKSLISCPSFPLLLCALSCLASDDFLASWSNLKHRCFQGEEHPMNGKPCSTGII